MSPFRTSRGGFRRAFGGADLLWLFLILVLLITILLPSLSRSRELANRAVCAANLRGIGQGCHIYAYDNQDWFPHHYYQRMPEDSDSRDIAVQWVGTMGSHDFLKITEATSPTKSPDRNHPSRSLFLLVVGGNNSPKQFQCPSSGDREDNLRNTQGGRQTAAQPGVNRFDFPGYHNLSYGYQLPYGNFAKPHARLDPRMVIGADKSPYFAAAPPALPDTQTTPDQRFTQAPPAFDGTTDPMALLKIPDQQWRPFNSRNHNREGQNALFGDSHVEFCWRPTVGVNSENIYTLQSDNTFAGSALGLVPGDDELIGPLTNTDSFIVP